VYRQDDWIEVDIKADALFASGSAAPREAALPVLQQIAGVLRGNRHLVRIEGHTDSQPIRFHRTGSCPPRAHPAWSDCSPSKASIPD